jgi:hypothetical protein
MTWTETGVELLLQDIDYGPLTRAINLSVSQGEAVLARKVLETVDLQRLTDIDYCCDKTISNVVLPALRDLFQREGVEVGGEGSRST